MYNTRWSVIAVVVLTATASIASAAIIEIGALRANVEMPDLEGVTSPVELSVIEDTGAAEPSGAVATAQITAEAPRGFIPTPEALEWMTPEEFAAVTSPAALEALQAVNPECRDNHSWNSGVEYHGEGAGEYMVWLDCVEYLRDLDVPTGVWVTRWNCAGVGCFGSYDGG